MSAGRRALFRYRFLAGRPESLACCRAAFNAAFLELGKGSSRFWVASKGSMVTRVVARSFSYTMSSRSSLDGPPITSPTFSGSASVESFY